MGAIAARAAGQLPYADFFRALAIFYVFLSHAGDLASEPHFAHHVPFSDAVTLFDGVAMLFCLSGFLLSAPMLRAYLDAPADLPPVRPYLLARFLRIYPLYVAAVIAIAAFLAISGKPPSPADLVLHLAMLQNFSVHTIQSLSGPLWTMPLDVQFYLVLPLAFALLARVFRDRDLTGRVVGLWAGLAAVVVLSVAYRFAVVWHWAPVGLDRQLFIVDQFPGMAALFALGIGARLVTMLIDRGELHWRPNALLLLGVAAVFRVLQYVAHNSWLHVAASSAHKAALFASVDEVLGGCGCACLLVAANYAGSGWFGRIVASPIVAFAAALSYGFYLFHYTVIGAVHDRFAGAGLRAVAELIAVSLVILVPLCALTYYGVEKYFLDRKARLKRVR